MQVAGFIPAQHRFLVTLLKTLPYVYTMIYHICCLRKSVAQDCDTEILKLMRFTISRVNLVFDVLYECGIFIPRAESIKAVEAGFDACAICLQQLRYEFICLCTISAG